MAKRKSSNPDQLSFFCGRPLEVVAQEICDHSSNLVIKDAAGQILEAMAILRDESGRNVDREGAAQVIHELLSK
jgi:hypothetical protein